MILASALVNGFRQSLAAGTGYIWGKTWEMWSDEKQAAYARDYADDQRRAVSVKHGGKWAGHYVTDCSGLFTHWFKELGGQMYHGSNTMYNAWCTSRGPLRKGERTDGLPLKPGTAVFTGDEKSKGHVGLYVGDGDVIEAAGTLQGVVVTKITSKWTYWGELKGVEYDGVQPQPAPEPEPGKAIVTGVKVALREGPSTSAKVLNRVNTGEPVTLMDLPEGWTYVNYRGKNGFMMDEFLNKGG